MEKHSNKKITFMLASSWYDDEPYEVIENDKINDFIWITEDNEYVLKWRNSNQESYKYLFNNYQGDKKWLISIAETY